jgi:prevent-host-death family protein
VPAVTDNCQTWDGYDVLMATITIRELARSTASVIERVESTGRPALVTRNGKPVAALVPIGERALHDSADARAAELIAAVAAPRPSGR